MGAVLPLAPVRTVHVFWDFDNYRVTLNVRGRRPRSIGVYSDLAAAVRAAERMRRIECIPTPPLVWPREAYVEKDGE